MTLNECEDHRLLALLTLDDVSCFYDAWLQSSVVLSASQGLLSPLCRTSTSNAAKAELLKSSKTRITPVTIFSVYCHLASASGAWWQKLQAPKLKLGLITSTLLYLIISKRFIILHHPYGCYVYTLYNLFAHSSCTFLLVLLFIKSTVYCPAHLNLIFYLIIFTPILMYILLCLCYI